MRRIAVAMTFGLICSSMTACGLGKFIGPTITPSPTNTPIPTFTSTPTSTSTPTLTPSPTNTPSPTSTPTPLGGSSGFVFAYFNRGYSPNLNLRGNSNVFYAKLDGSGLRPITNGLLGNNTVAGISPDGKQVLIQSALGDTSALYVANLDGSNLHRVDQDTTTAWRGTWLSNGQIAYVANNHVCVVNPDGTGLLKSKFLSGGYTPFLIYGYSQGRVIFLQISSGSSWNENTDLRYMMLDGSGTIGQVSFINGRGYDYILSPDGKKMAMGGEPTSIVPITLTETGMVVDISRGETIPLPNDYNPTSDVYFEPLQFSPDGNILLVSVLSDTPDPLIKDTYDENYSFYTWSDIGQIWTQIPKLNLLYPRGSWQPFQFFLSPDGGQVLQTDQEDYVALINTASGDVDRKFGCVVSKACPAKPNLNTQADYYHHRSLRLIDTVFWIPSQ